MVERGLDFRRPYLETGGVDHALQPVDDEKVALVIVITEIAGAEEALAVEFDERSLGRRRILPVTVEYLRAVRDDFADLAGRQFGERVRVDHARIGVADRDAEALLFYPCGRVDVRRRDRFRQSVALDITQPGQVLQAAGHGLRHGRAAAADVLEAGDVVIAERGIGEKVDRHRGDVGPAVHLVALDQLTGGVAVPARHHHDGRAAPDRLVHTALHSGHMEERQRRHHHRFRIHADPERAGEDGAHHRAMGVNATFRAAGGARGIGHHAQVIGAGKVR